MKRQAIAILVFVSVATTAVFAQSNHLTVEKIYRDFDFSAHKLDELRWLPQSERYSYIKRDSTTGEQQLVIERAADGTEKVLLRQGRAISDDSTTISLSSYQWMPDESGVILTENGDIWRYSLKEKQLERLTDTDVPEEEVQISPNSRYVSYVRDHNLYVTDLKSGKEQALTRDGNKQRFNGKLDWVYQEELVGRGIFKGYWWSPDSRYIAYLQFDESPVPDYPLVDQIPYHPNLKIMQYPKAGDPNPMVKLGVVNIRKSPKTVWMDVGEKTDQYIPRVYWVPDGKQLAFMRLDRHQQRLELLLADVSDGGSHVILKERDPHWINIEDQVHFFEDSQRFLWGSDRSGYRHLYLYNLNGDFINQMTSGEWVVTEFVGVDEQRDQVYFLANKDDVRERQLYRVNMDGRDLTRISTETGTHEIDLSPNRQFNIDEYSDVLRPEQQSLHTAEGAMVRSLSDPVQPPLSEFDLQMSEYFTFEDDSGHTFYASMLKPPNFDPDKKYPVLVYVYGGPHSQVVQREFGRKRNLWHQMLAQRGYIIFSMDNRGSYGRGHHWEEVIYENLGATELRDQLKGVAYLKSQPYVDDNRIGIWGWSYGGYMTLFALTHTEAFTTGISVAPVTDWRNYDTIYTERYMGLPSENPQGYTRSAPTNFAGNLSGKLLLVHGTADDNVHFQNSLQMVNALVEANKDFDFMVYPQQKHGISPTKDRMHLFNKMTKFIEENL